MSLEQALAENTAAIKVLTELLVKSQTEFEAPKSDKTEAPKKTAPAKKETKAEMTTKPKDEAPKLPDYETEVKPAFLKFVADHGREAGVQLLDTHFGVVNAKLLAPVQYAAFLKAASEYKAAEATAESEDDDLA